MQQGLSKQSFHMSGWTYTIHTWERKRSTQEAHEADKEKKKKQEEVIELFKDEYVKNVAFFFFLFGFI